jgi:osmotically inducible protein OsmC
MSFTPGGDSRMPLRNANAVWEGTIKDGGGIIRLGSGACEGPYSFASRFERGTGTNPEELIGAAHAGCFSMALADALAARGVSPEIIRTDAEVDLEPVSGGYEIKSVRLIATAVVPGINDAGFRECAAHAKQNCPVSRALSGVEIKLEAKLAQKMAREVAKAREAEPSGSGNSGRVRRRRHGGKGPGRSGK